MKRLIIIVCIIALVLGLASVAYAANETQTSEEETSQGEQIPAEIPQGDRQEPPAPPEMVDFDDMVSKGVISQETCDKIKAYMEDHKPADLPGSDSQTPGTEGQAPGGNSQAPGMKGRHSRMNGQRPQMNGQAPDANGGNAQMPGIAGQQPQKNGQRPQMNGQCPQTDAQTPGTDDQTPDSTVPSDVPSLPDAGGKAPAGDGLLDDLLSSGVITQDEYNALKEAAGK